MGKNKKTTGDTYLPVRIGIGLSLGAVLGLTLFDELAIGAGIGLVLGVMVGTTIDSDKAKKE
ncbi:glycine zipper family protein [Halobacillus faecis]